MKKLITLTLTVALCMTLFTVFSAAGRTTDPDSQPVFGSEEQEWYFRDNDGQLEKRLWSITKGEWIGSWEDAAEN